MGGGTLINKLAPKFWQFNYEKLIMSHTIALVDDDRNLLTSISIALEREGFKVQTYIDGESAF